MVKVRMNHRAAVGLRWRKHAEFLSCALVVIVTAVIASNGSGRPESRVTFLELDLVVAILIGFVTNFAGSLFYVAYHEEQSDAWALARARIGVTVAIILFAFALFRFHSLFSVWWVWDRALIWAALVVPLYVSYLLLRGYANPGQGPTLAAVFAIFAFLDLPIAYFAAVLRVTPASLSKQIDGAYSLTASMWLIVALAVAATWLMYRWEVRQRNEGDRSPVTVA